MAPQLLNKVRYGCTLGWPSCMGILFPVPICLPGLSILGRSSGCSMKEGRDIVRLYKVILGGAGQPRFSVRSNRFNSPQLDSPSGVFFCFSLCRRVHESGEPAPS